MTKTQKIQKVLFMTMLVELPVCLGFLTVFGYFQLVILLRDKVFTDPNAQITFLALPTGQLKLQTTQPLQIEYSVLKVPAVKTTAAKK